MAGGARVEDCPILDGVDVQIDGAKQGCSGKSVIVGGVGQQENKLMFNLFVSLLEAPNRQKLLNHAGFAYAGGGAKPYEGGGGMVVGVAGGKG